MTSSVWKSSMSSGAFSERAVPSLSDGKSVCVSALASACWDCSTPEQPVLSLDTTMFLPARMGSLGHAKSWCHSALRTC